jgi:hypothetical protein
MPIAKTSHVVPAWTPHRTFPAAHYGLQQMKGAKVNAVLEVGMQIFAADLSTPFAQQLCSMNTPLPATAWRACECHVT